MKFRAKAEAIAYMEGVKQGYYEAKNMISKMQDDFGDGAFPEMYMEEQK